MLTHFFKKKLLKISSYLPDYMFLKIRYKRFFKRTLNLTSPKRFTEKLMWYKLYYRDPLMSTCADKYKVRDYIISKGYEKNLVKLYQVAYDWQSINKEELPEKFVIKGNNGSGSNIFVTNKNMLNEGEVLDAISKWKLFNDVDILGREWCYKNIKFRITIEELLEPENEIGINDYKFLCFNGMVKYIWVDNDRFSEHKRTFFDINWNKIDVSSDKPVSSVEIERPWGLDEMISIAQDIATDFPFARVDFYSVNQKVYFGEITFYPWSGFVKFTPDEFDFTLGDAFKLPEKYQV